MTETSEKSTRSSILDRMKDAALDELRERQDEHRRVADIVLGAGIRDTRKRVTDVINLGGDYLVEVTDRDAVTWTFVVGGKRASWHHARQEDAILHLIASRYDDNPNTNVHAAFYARRVLGVPDSEGD